MQLKRNNFVKLSNTMNQEKFNVYIPERQRNSGRETMLKNIGSCSYMEVQAEGL